MKYDRHQKIIELIEKYDIKTQEELTKKLHEAGYDVTQATVSRDIKDMNLQKASNKKNGRKRYVLPDSHKGGMADKYVRIIKDGLVKMETAQNILVFKTVPGMAMAVAAAIDSLNYEEIVGSIAGDDNIIAVTKTSETAELLMEKVRETLKKEA